LAELGKKLPELQIWTNIDQDDREVATETIATEDGPDAEPIGSRTTKSEGAVLAARVRVKSDTATLGSSPTALGRFRPRINVIPITEMFWQAPPASRTFQVTQMKQLRCQ